MTAGDVAKNVARDAVIGITVGKGVERAAEAAGPVLRRFVREESGAVGVPGKGGRTSARPSNSPHYSTSYEVELPEGTYPGMSRPRHNQLSNESLHEAFRDNPGFAAEMEKLYPGIVEGVQPGPRGAFSRSAPTPDVTWHHGETPGKMQLVPTDHHRAPGPVQDTLHPDGFGGFSIWGR